MKMHLSDRIALAISPEAGAKRIAQRMKVQALMDVSARDNFDSSGSVGVPRSETRWRGASQTLRSMAGWITTLGSGRSDTTRSERERMAARAFDAYRNHMLGRAAVSRVRTNVVGTGLVMHPTVDAEALGISEDEADQLNTQIARQWPLFFENPLEIDMEATLDGYGLQSLALAAALLFGDCFALTPVEDRAGGLYRLKVQLVDGGRVSNPNLGPNTPLLQDGVTLTSTGMPVAVSIRRRHPADDVGLGMSYDANIWDTRPIFGDVSGQRRILQIWNDKDRIGATRGVSYLAPILEPLQTLEQYSRAEMIAAVVSAMFTVFIEKTAEQLDERGNPLPAIEGQTTKGAASDLQLGVASVLDLGPGEKASFANPSRPNANYDPFFLSIVRQIGAALEIPVDELLLNYQASYSAARAAMLQAWRFYQMRRWYLVQQFCQPIYCLWFDEEVAAGRLPVKGYDDPTRRAAYHSATWIGPARGAMDEVQETTAARSRIDGGFSNETVETAQMTGQAWNTVYAQRKRELDRRRKDGNLPIPAPGTHLAPTDPNNPTPGAPGGGAPPPPGNARPTPNGPPQQVPGTRPVDNPADPEPSPGPN